MVNFKHVSISVFILAALGCGQEVPDSPICRINDNKVDSVHANAGCIVRVDERILVIEHRLSGRFDIPGGIADEGESAQCAAHRETWEETGFNVEVNERLGVSTTGFHFYHCQLDDDFGGTISDFPVPNWSSSEVLGIKLVDPFETEDKAWRRPEQLVFLRDMFNKIDAE